MMRAPNYPLTLFFDGACALCRLEMDRLRERDGVRRLVFVDISAPDFDCAKHVADSGVTTGDMRRLIHGRLADGTVLAGVKVLQLAYSAVGWAPLMLPTRLPLVQPLLEKAYAVFARNRYGISAAVAPLIHRIEAGRSARRAAACRDGVCDPRTHRSTP